MVSKKAGWLYGWKEIANYCGCCIATAKKYAKKKDLPVQRPFGNKVAAIPKELDSWLKQK